MFFDVFTFFFFLSLFWMFFFCLLLSQAIFRWLASFFFWFLRRALCDTWKKIHVQVLVLNKKAVVKTYRIIQLKEPTMKPCWISQRVFLGKCLKSSVLNFLSSDCELILKLERYLIFTTTHISTFARYL